jgi:DNA-binding GntR family transcriptional regulator
MLELIQPISKRAQVVRAMKEAILSGTIEPGASIVESKMAQQLGAGIPLIREALIELEHEGFVQRVPYKGTTVTKLEPEDVKRIFRLRVELEALAIEWAKEKITDRDLESLRNRIQKMEEAARVLDLTQFYENDLAFHRHIWILSDNPYLADALERVVTPLFAFFLMKTNRQRESYVESAEMHKSIVEAIPVKSAIELREMMKQSLANWKDDMLDLLFPSGAQK